MVAHANFAGVRVDAVTFEELRACVLAWCRDKSAPSCHIAPINAYCVSLTLADEALRDIYARAEIAGPDGMPFVFWIRRCVRASCDRLYAPDIVLDLARLAETTPLSFYLYGGSEQTNLGMRRFLESRFPWIRIVGACAPPFRPQSEDEDREVCRELNALAPDVVFVGLGTPKQDYWIDAHRKRIRGTVFVGCGATFDFFGGRVRPAPRLVQRSGFEWLWRLLSRDFRRLFWRYTVMHGRFLLAFALQLA
jgi:N-acetylglucosaminyldiphosphoundecaprenol N-acetyl-beta-D-mannosaminyltransferase